MDEEALGMDEEVLGMDDEVLSMDEEALSVDMVEGGEGGGVDAHDASQHASASRTNKAKAKAAATSSSSSAAAPVAAIPTPTPNPRPDPPTMESLMDLLLTAKAACEEDGKGPMGELEAACRHPLSFEPAPAPKPAP